MSGRAERGGPDWGLRAAFVLNIAALLFAIYCAVVIISFLHCFSLVPAPCQPWTSHIPSSVRALAAPAVALTGTIQGVRLARRGERARAIRALIGWSALSLGVFMSFALWAPA